MKLNKTDVLLVIISVLMIVVLYKQLFPPKQIDNSQLIEINNKIKSLQDSLNTKQFVINSEQVKVESYKLEIKQILNQIKNINEKLRKDTLLINNYSNKQLDSFFRSRYNY